MFIVWLLQMTIVIGVSTSLLFIVHFEVGGNICINTWTKALMHFSPPANNVSPSYSRLLESHKYLPFLLDQLKCL